MSTSCRLAAWAAAAAVGLAAAGSAFAQVQNKDQQKCISTFNKDTCKVAATQGKANAGCVKAAAKGDATSGCLTADPSGKIAKKKSKTTSDETKNDCLGANAPGFGYSDGSAGNATATGEEVALFLDTYGTTDPTAVVSTAKLEGGCQSAVTADLEKVIAAKWKEFVGCKNTALRTASSAADLGTCITPGGIALDAKGKITRALAKLNADITGKCAGIDVATTFPGNCKNSPLGSLGTCLDTLAECRACRALNEIDELQVNCDLFDDNVANGSCPLSEHTCVLAGGSSFKLYAAAYGVTPVIGALTGAVGIGGATSEAACSAQAIDPLSLVGIGVVCVSPTNGCSPGHRYCGPGSPGSGPALGVAATANGNAGACTGNPACATTCASTCGGAANVLASGCTGFCSGGDQSSCTSDAQCLVSPKGGVCNGPNPIGAHAGVCQCSCVNRTSYGGSDPGDFACDMGVSLVVEMAAPCDGTDIVARLGSSCIALSTERASGVVNSANFIGATVPPSGANDQTGIQLPCASVDSAALSGLTGVGAAAFFGSSPLGDLSIGVKTICQ
jgi:hypothetical protein